MILNTMTEWKKWMYSGPREFSKIDNTILNKVIKKYKDRPLEMRILISYGILTERQLLTIVSSTSHIENITQSQTQLSKDVIMSCIEHVRADYIRNNPKLNATDKRELLLLKEIVAE